MPFFSLKQGIHHHCSLYIGLFVVQNFHLFEPSERFGNLIFSPCIPIGEGTEIKFCIKSGHGHFMNDFRLIFSKDSIHWKEGKNFFFYPNYTLLFSDCSKIPFPSLKNLCLDVLSEPSCCVDLNLIPQQLQKEIQELDLWKRRFFMNG